MQTRSQMIRIAAAASVGLTGAAATAQPAVLDHVPTDNTAYVVVPDLSELFQDFNGALRPLREAFGEQVAEAGAFVPLLQLFANSPGMNANGAAAIAVELPAEGDPAGLALEDLAEMVSVILPVTDMDAFRESPLVQGQNQALGDGLYEVKIQMLGATVYMRDLGDYAVLGGARERVSGFDARGKLAEHRRMLGEVGVASARMNDALLVTPMAPFSDGIDELLEQIEGQAAFAAALAGGQQGQVDAGVSIVREVLENFVRDAESGVIGFDFGPEGLSLDVLSNFRRGSELAGIFDTAPSTDGLIGNLPEGPYVVAYAQNNTDGLVARLTENVEEMLPGEEQASDLNPTGDFTSRAAYAFMLAPSPAFGGGGLLSNSVTYARGDGMAAKYREVVREADGQTAAGVRYETGYDRDAIEIDGVRVDGYSMKLSYEGQGPGAGSPLAQSPFADPTVIMSLLYGAGGGPSGYVAQRGGGAYVTGGKNSELLAASFKAADGQASLTNNAALRSVMDRLPENRNGELYVNLNSILETVLSFAQMAGGAIELPEIPQMPPIGAASVVTDGGVMLRVHVPMSVITTSGKLFEQFGGALGDAVGGPNGPAF